MPAARSQQTAPASPLLDAFAEVSEAVESGAGLPSVARAAARALEASVVVLDATSAVVAVACLSPEDERAVLASEGATEVTPLRIADTVVGHLHVRPHAEPAAPVLTRMVTTLIAQEVERAAAPDRASEAAVGDFLADLFGRTLTDRENITARADELGADLDGGGTVVVARARPGHAEEGDWRARVLSVAERGARGVDRTCLIGSVELGPPRSGGADGRVLAPGRELVVLVPAASEGAAVAEAVLRELEQGLSGYATLVALSRFCADPTDLHRAAAEALLTANVGEGRGEQLVRFEETGAYRLLLPAMSEDPGELWRFHEETVAPLLDYDRQYETDLVHTLESFLEADGNVAKTAEKLFTHRHTVRYRLDRVRELSGLDVNSTDGRERLSLGLKSMRVLGVAAPGGPASESGAGAGRVRRDEKDR